MTTKPIKRVAVTGGAGQIAYSLLFRIAAGELFGRDQPVALHILEIPQAMQALEGVAMELADGAFPLLSEVVLGDDPNRVFKGVDYAFLVGAMPRGPGMERKDLLNANGQIFIGQGRALNAVASSDVKVLVVGNPCNTNALIAMTHAPDIPRKNFHAMTRLDQNRAQSLLAGRAGVAVSEVKRVTIWGNHSTTQVPDFYHATVSGRVATQAINDEAWLQGAFIQKVQKRGAEIIKARGKSSAASAANAALDAMKALVTPTPEGEWFSSGVCSDGNPYGIQEDLIFSFPCRSKGDGDYEIVAGLDWNAFLQERIEASQAELVEEKNLFFDSVEAQT